MNGTTSSIFKYQLEIIEHQIIRLSSKPLSVINQHNKIMLYAYSGNKSKPFLIYIVETGRPIEEIIRQKYTFLDTVSLFDGDLIFHVFYMEIEE